MKIIVQFEFEYEELKRRHREGRKPVFGLFLRFRDGTSYPDETFTDFGCVVLGWWLVDILKLQKGARSGQLTFMDGPYAVDLEEQKGLYVANIVEGKAAVDDISLNALIEQWCGAAEAVATYFDRYCLFQTEAEILRKGIEMLRKE